MLICVNVHVCFEVTQQVSFLDPVLELILESYDSPNKQHYVIKVVYRQSIPHLECCKTLARLFGQPRTS